MISGGETFRKIAKENDIDLLNLGIIAEKNYNIDMKIDELYKTEVINNDNLILEGRLAAYMIQDINVKIILKIWLKASIETRILRIKNREKASSYKIEMENTLKRETSEKNRYKKYYNIDIDNLDLYDIILDTNIFNQFQIINFLTIIINEFIKTKHKD